MLPPAGQGHGPCPQPDHGTPRQGDQDRVTLFPATARRDLVPHLERGHAQHDRDRARGAGWVELPDALARKLPNAGREWPWQRVCSRPLEPISTPLPGQGDGCGEFDFKPAVVSGFIYGPPNDSAYPSAITRYSGGIPFGNIIFFDFDTQHYPKEAVPAGRLLGTARFWMNPFTGTMTVFYTGRSDGANPIPPIEEKNGRSFRWRPGRCDLPKKNTAQTTLPFEGLLTESTQSRFTAQKREGNREAERLLHRCETTESAIANARRAPQSAVFSHHAKHSCDDWLTRSDCTPPFVRRFHRQGSSRRAVCPPNSRSM
jgi:hypothetical protein